jgi:hypothetical protein
MYYTPGESFLHAYTDLINVTLKFLALPKDLSYLSRAARDLVSQCNQAPTNECPAQNIYPRIHHLSLNSINTELYVLPTEPPHIVVRVFALFVIMNFHTDFLTVGLGVAQSDRVLDFIHLVSQSDPCGT